MSNMEEAIRRVNSGELTASEASRLYKIPRSTLRDRIASNTQGVNTPSEPNIPIDRRNIDGSVEIVTYDKPLTLDELIELFSIDTAEWEVTYFKPNSWEGYYKLKEGHRKVRLYQSKAVFQRIKSDSAVKLVEWLNTHITPLAPNLIKPLRLDALDGQTVIWGLWDAHLGMYAWNSETNNDYDLGIAVTRIKNSVDDMVADLADYPIRQLFMPIGNDFLHFDNARQTTTQGTHHLDCDSRYSKAYLAGLECLAYMLERAIQITHNVKVLFIPGNHDHLTSFTLCVALAQRFRHYTEIEFDISPNPRKYVHWGSVIVGFDHGDKVRKGQYPIIFATEPGSKEHISKSTWREVQVGHTHQKAEDNWAGITPLNGLLIRTNPSLCNNDYWHHSLGLLGEPVKSVEAWRYNDIGYIGSHVGWARD